MVSVYDFADYKRYFNSWVEQQPKQGHGEYRRVSLKLNVSTTMISQVFKGDKQLSLEMASDLCDYLNLEEDESEYFIILVEMEKAGSIKLRKRFEKQQKLRQEKAKKLENRVKKVIELDDATKSIYYSSWIYSGIRNLTSLPEFNDAASISERLHLPRNQVQKILDFLVSNKLCVAKDGELNVGPAQIFMGSSNLLVSKHHQNWRLQGFQKMIHADDQQFFFTMPMNLSVKVADRIRNELGKLVDQIIKEVGPTESETVRCLNIDWFEY